jgi:hypothetical protein
MAYVVEGLGCRGLSKHRGAEVYQHLTVAAVSSREARGDGGVDLSSVVQQEVEDVRPAVGERDSCWEYCETLVAWGNDGGNSGWI